MLARIKVISAEAYLEGCLNLILNVNPLSANPTKWSNRLKQFVVKLPTNCLCVFDHFMGLLFKGLSEFKRIG